MPNSLTELNVWSNIARVYTDQRSYSITFSANAASNTSTSIDEDQSFTVPTGINISQVLSQPGNITYTINAVSAGNSVATWPSLPTGISNTSAGNGLYSITGTFDATTWTAAKGLVMTFPDKVTNFSFTANLAYPSTANTANTNVWSWTNSVTYANVNPDLSLTTDYNWQEGNTVTFVYSIDDLDPTATFNMTFLQTVGNTGIITVNGTSAGLGNTATVTGNRAVVNAANVTFYPYPDSVANVVVVVNAVKTNPFGNVIFANNVATALTCTGTHSEYSLTDAYTYNEDTPTTMVFDVLDTDDSTNSYIATFAQTSGNTGLFTVNGVSQGLGNSAVLSNSRGNISNATVIFNPYPDTISNVGLTYTQIKSTPLFGNIVQANAVPITVTIANTHTDFTVTNSYSVDEDQGNVDMVFNIADTDTAATGYTSTFQHSSGGTAGVFYVNGVSQGVGNAAVIANSRANINTANVTYLPYPDYAGNTVLTYTQTKTTPLFGNTVQANAVPLTITIGNSHSEYSLTTSFSYSEDTTRDMAFQVLDTDVNADYHIISFNQLTGNTAGVFFFDGTQSGNVGEGVELQGAAASLNTANISYLPGPDEQDPITIGYSQIKHSTVFGNITQASNVVITLTCSNAHADTSFAATNSYVQNTRKNILGNTITDTDANASSYTVALQQVSGNVGRWIVNGANVGYSNSVYAISNSKANINTANLQYLPSIDNQGNVTLRYLQYKTTPIFGNTLSANVDGVYSMSSTVPHVNNMITRSYTANTVNMIFSSPPVTILDGDIGSYVGNYSATFSSATGKFGNSAANAILSNTYTITGSNASMNSQFANVRFVPNPGAFTGNGTFTYTQVLDGVTQINNQVVNLTGVDANLAGLTKSYVTSTSDKTFNPTFEQSYYARANVLLVGGGGGGGGGANTGGPGSGGGGAGEVKLDANVQLSTQTYTITVGAGGAGGSTATNGSAGSSSLITAPSGPSYGANGGGGGFGAEGSGYYGGTSGNGYLGGGGGTQSGGGGGGAGSVGGDGATVGTPPYIGGVGGSGQTFDISGSSTVYGIGGSGASLSANGVSNVANGSGGGGGKQVTAGLAGVDGTVVIKLVPIP